MARSLVYLVFVLEDYREWEGWSGCASKHLQNHVPGEVLSPLREELRQ